MHFNPLLIPTVVLAFGFFYAGYQVSARTSSFTARVVWMTIAILSSVPGLLMPMYYLHVFDRWELFYSCRAAPLSELTASASGLLAGTLTYAAVRLGAHRFVVTMGLLIILTLGLAAPYAKPILAPVDPSVYRNEWREDVCLQSTASCGAASAATILRLYGIDATEREIADECYTYVAGTEAWYLARALRRRGLNVAFVVVDPPVHNLPVPSIAGTNVGLGQAGHFITILEETEEYYVVGDPMSGRSRHRKDGIFQDIDFTGFFMHVTRAENE